MNRTSAARWWLLASILLTLAGCLWLIPSLWQGLLLALLLAALQGAAVYSANSQAAQLTPPPRHPARKILPSPSSTRYASYSLNCCRCGASMSSWRAARPSRLPVA